MAKTKTAKRMRRALTTEQMRFDRSGNLTANKRSIANATMILDGDGFD